MLGDKVVAVPHRKVKVKGSDEEVNTWLIHYMADEPERRLNIVDEEEHKDAHH